MLPARISRTLFVLPSLIRLVIGPLILLSPPEKNRQPGNLLKNSISCCLLASRSSLGCKLERLTRKMPKGSAPDHASKTLCKTAFLGLLEPGQSWNGTLQHVANAFNKNLVIPFLTRNANAGGVRGAHLTFPVGPTPLPQAACTPSDRTPSDAVNAK